jgi:hypothetical protein
MLRSPKEIGPVQMGRGMFVSPKGACFRPDEQCARRGVKSMSVHGARRMRAAAIHTAFIHLRLGWG